MAYSKGRGYGPGICDISGGMCIVFGIYLGGKYGQRHF